MDNCQTGVFAALAQGRDACLINKRLYLLKAWCENEERCHKAGISGAMRTYKSRARLALELIDDADRQGLDYAWLGMDAEFGVPWAPRGLDRRGKRFLVDVASSFYVYLTHPRLRVRPKMGAARHMEAPYPISASPLGWTPRHPKRADLV